MIAPPQDRHTARADKPVVLFLIGMRINKPLAVGKWRRVAAAMPKMLKELSARPDSGLLWFHTYLSVPVIMVQQYWESFDKLLAYAHDKSGAHFPAWGEFNRRIGYSEGAVGIWHETYLIEPGKFETVYGNMPPFGLAAATSRVPAEGRLAAAKNRFQIDSASTP
ncbi:MAG: DUF4188 domain-containing protein [Alphaproteobacteria bacterium]|nr:DUF4188 domain-containing protein [Alphaproteobacteria bacterium]